MSKTNVVFTSIVTVLVLLSAAFFSFNSAQASGYERYGMGKHGGMMGMACSPKAGERMDNKLARGQEKLALTAEQMPAWEQLVQQLQSVRAQMSDYCASERSAGIPVTAPEKVTRMQAMMMKGADLMAQVQPALQNFYDVLNADQKQMLDTMGPRRGYHGRYDAWKGYDDDRDDD